ncbi:1574_t:CDS:1 [Funneliformis geosporum]|nr:1574_t:CDS:1 [Funneliformis geosporum]
MTTKKIPISKKTVSVTVDPVNFSDDDVKFLDFEDSRSFEKLVVERSTQKCYPKTANVPLGFLLNQQQIQANNYYQFKKPFISFPTCTPFNTKSFTSPTKWSYPSPTKWK